MLRAGPGRLLVAALLLSMLLSCAGSGSSSGSSAGVRHPERFEPSQWLPQDADLLLKVDVRALRQSPYAHWLSHWSIAALHALGWHAGLLADPRVSSVASKAEVFWLALRFNAQAKAPEVTMVARVDRALIRGEEPLLDGGRAVQYDAHTVLLSSRRDRLRSGRAWPLPLTGTAPVAFIADGRALSKQLQASAERWGPLAGASRVQGDVRFSDGLAVVVTLGSSPQWSGVLVDGWLEGLRDDLGMRLLGLYQALLHTRVEASSDSTALVLAVESPDAEIVCGAIDKGMEEMAKAGAYASFEEYFTSSATPGERMWDESTCRELDWTARILQRYEQVGVTRWQPGRGYVQETSDEMRMKLRQANYLLDSKCSMRGK